MATAFLIDSLRPTAFVDTLPRWSFLGARLSLPPPPPSPFPRTNVLVPPPSLHIYEYDPWSEILAAALFAIFSTKNGLKVHTSGPIDIYM